MDVARESALEGPGPYSLLFLAGGLVWPHDGKERWSAIAKWSEWCFREAPRTSRSLSRTFGCVSLFLAGFEAHRSPCLRLDGVQIHHLHELLF